MKHINELNNNIFNFKIEKKERKELNRIKKELRNNKDWLKKINRSYGAYKGWITKYEKRGEYEKAEKIESSDIFLNLEDYKRGIEAQIDVLKFSLSREEERTLFLTFDGLEKIDYFYKDIKKNENPTLKILKDQVKEAKRGLKEDKKDPFYDINVNIKQLKTFNFQIFRYEYHIDIFSGVPESEAEEKFRRKMNKTDKVLDEELYPIFYEQFVNIFIFH